MKISYDNFGNISEITFNDNDDQKELSGMIRDFLITREQEITKRSIDFQEQQTIRSKDWVDGQIAYQNQFYINQLGGNKND